MALNQIVSRLQNHISDVVPTQDMRDEEVATRRANRNNIEIIQERKATTGKTVSTNNFRPFGTE